MIDKIRSKFVAKTFSMLLLVLLLSASMAVAGENVSIEEVKKHLEKHYVEPVDFSNEQLENLEDIWELLDDPYTNYFTPVEFEDYMERIEGHFGGVGIQVESVDGYTTVVAPLRGTPAFDADIEPRDRIIAVDEIDVVNVPLEQVTDIIRGEPGTEVILTIMRGEDVFEVSLIREKIVMDSVVHELLDHNVGYIGIQTFGERTYLEVSRALLDLENQGAEALIIDLRYNGGGLLHTAVGISELLVPRAPIVHIVDRQGKEQSITTSGSGIDKPVAVLINQGSASASEILAAAIRENQVGTLVGTESFGKASVQSMRNLSDGGVLKLTTAYYLTPDKNMIHGEGLKPDIYIEDWEMQVEAALAHLRSELEHPEVGDGIILSANSDRSFIEGGRTYAQVRFISENLGFGVDWDQTTKSVFVTGGEKQLVMGPDDEQGIIIKGGRSYLPLRYLVEALGGTIHWNDANGNVEIYK
ncbi:carboxyl-terminal processing protease [Desulfitispora alkaliphila]|uniref:S41 family peptidase n=1 Tax=Desulfitispora alkaliphila TaxID=622674 RepID=UPI003D194C8B